MANTFTSLAPVLYSDAVAVPRELIGGLMAVRRDFDDKGVAQGDPVKVTVAPSLSSSSVTPAQTFTKGTDRTASSRQLTLSNYKQVDWHLTAEEDRSLQNAGVAQDLFAQTVQQGFRTLANEIEADALTSAYQGASRAHGTSGTTPFGSSLTELANLKKILDDNGAGLDRSLVINTDAMVNLLELTQLTNANQFGDRAPIAEGAVARLFGFDIYVSDGVVSHTKGTGSGYLINLTAGYSVGDTTFAADTGSGTILAGDVITIGTSATTPKYVVGTALSGGSLAINDPGLTAAIANNAPINVQNSFAANVGMDRSAVVAVARPALQPDGAIAEQMVVTDPTSGISALMLRVPGDSLVSYYMRVVYDSFAPNPHAAAILLG